MAVAFVTGATGFIGRNLLMALSQRNWTIHALVRDKDSRKAKQIADIPGVFLVAGDIRIAHSLVRLVPPNVDVVFHCAADTSTWSGHKLRQSDINVEGTRNIIYATYEAKAQVLVHVSTAAVYGQQKTQPYTEAAPKLGMRCSSNYVRSKLEAENIVIRAVERGLDAVIVNPGQVLGRFDTTNWASLIRMTDNQTLPGIPPGSGCFAEAGAVVQAMIRAAEVGKKGENYLLGGPHASFEDVVQIIAQELGKEPPAKVIPPWMLRGIGQWNTLKARLTRKEPAGMTQDAAWFVSRDDHFTSDKAIKELGYAPPTLKMAVKTAIAWQASEGLVSPVGQTSGPQEKERGDAVPAEKKVPKTRNAFKRTPPQVMKEAEQTVS